MYMTLTSFSDVLAHRQLAAAIYFTLLHPSLHSKAHVERMLDVVNRRHRMAQMAGRASVEFYVGLALKAKNERGGNADVLEDAFVIRTFKNGLAVFVSKYGIVCSHSLCKTNLFHETWYSRTGAVQTGYAIRCRKLHNHCQRRRNRGI